ncbi:hypothetical protein Dda_6964 [Drechslerella dactyloides]|uniref:Uncharacterized protein n=1 Tax=Drechslerella dactyloides TaxID=74499 RepID=A0AAD6NH78_DREDA|nr:hypothetical protein Dda_6964 [Drechslerella dactyloides]
MASRSLNLASSPITEGDPPGHVKRHPDCPYGWDFAKAANLSEHKRTLYHKAGRELANVWTAWRQLDPLCPSLEESSLEHRLTSYRDYVRVNKLKLEIVLSAAIWNADMSGQIPDLPDTDHAFPPELQSLYANSVPPRFRVSRRLWEEGVCLCGLTHTRGGSTADPIELSSGEDSGEEAPKESTEPKTPVKVKKEVGTLTPQSSGRKKRAATGAVREVSASRVKKMRK